MLIFGAELDVMVINYALFLWLPPPHTSGMTCISSFHPNKNPYKYNPWPFPHPKTKTNPSHRQYTATTILPFPFSLYPFSSFLFHNYLGGGGGEYSPPPLSLLYPRPSPPPPARVGGGGVGAASGAATKICMYIPIQHTITYIVLYIRYDGISPQLNISDIYYNFLQA
jgi:hypothetical protein